VAERCSLEDVSGFEGDRFTSWLTLQGLGAERVPTDPGHLPSSTRTPGDRAQEAKQMLWANFEARSLFLLYSRAGNSGEVLAKAYARATTILVK
jgi:hypothetical protein